MTASDQPPTGIVTPLRVKRPCPECGKQSGRDTYPFCSQRCKEVDLNRWLTGSYVIPGDPAEEEADPSGVPAKDNGGEQA